MSSIKIRGTVNNCWGIDRYCIYSADTFHLFVEKTGLHWLLVLVTSLSKILLIIDKLDLAGSSSAYLMSEVEINCIRFGYPNLGSEITILKKIPACES